MEVSVTFMCGAVELLGEQYGNKMTDSGEDGKFNQILEHLTEIERLWQELDGEAERGDAVL